MNKVLLISEDYIKSVTNISDNINGNFLLPAIQLAQDIELTETIGTPLLTHLQELIYNNKIQLEENKDYKHLLDKYLQPLLAYNAIQHIVVPISFKVANAGVLRTDDEKMYNASTNEVDKVKAYYKHIADMYQYRLQRYLIANYNRYPELLEYKSIADIRANLYSSASCNLWLGGPRSKIMPFSNYYGYGYNFPNRTIDIL